MPTPLRRSVRLLHRGAWYGIAAILILMALAAGVTSQLLPMAERHPDRIAAWLSERAGRPVAFDRVETEWTRRGPLLRLDGLRIGAGRDAVPIGEAEILVAQYAGLLPGRSFTELRLRGLSLTLERGADRRWTVRGFPGQQQRGGDPLSTLEGLGELQVIDGRLAILAPSMGIDVQLPDIDLRMQVNGDRLRAGVRGTMARDASPIDAVLDFDRRAGNGRIYAGARRADLDAWTSLLRFAGIAVQRGNGRVQAWGELRAHRIASIRLDAELEHFVLQAAGAGAGAAPARTQFEEFEAHARWQAIEGGWRLDAPRLRMTNGQTTQQLDGLTIAGGARYALVADRIDAGPLLAVAALSDRLAPGLRNWLSQARPSLRLERVVVAGERGGRMRADAVLGEAAFGPVGDAPGIGGLRGEVHGDGQGFSLQLLPASRLRFDWPSGFGAPHDLEATGTISGWREGAGWQVATDRLQLAGSGYSADVRGGLLFQGDGSRPRIDLATSLGDVTVAAAKTLWVRHRMSPNLIRWLDAALVGGTVHGGRAIVSGDLDEWPFRDRNGRFEASGTIRRGVIRFQPEWPALDVNEARIAFTGDAMVLDGAGAISGVGIRAMHAEIPKFAKAVLTVDAQGGGDAANMLTLLRHSPLQKSNATTLARIDASGIANVALELVQPLYRGASGQALDGKVQLLGATLVDRELDLKFEDVRGDIDFGRGGFGAEKLAVRHEQQPGRLSLRAGDYVRDARQGFEAELDATMAADALIDRAPDLAWLKPHMDGRSTWTVAVAIPRSGNAAQQAPSRVQLRSNLVGTALTLPAPLDKPAGATLPTTVDIPLPVGTGEIKVALGNLLAVRARTSNNQTGIRAVLGADSVNEPAPPSGLIATGRAGVLDAIDWIGVAKGGGQGKGLALRRIDVTADRLLLLGGAFRNTRLQVTPAGNDTAIQLQGDSLAGALLVPQSDVAAIAGRLDRLHWRSASPSGGATGRVAAVPPATNALDAGRIPPLTIDVTDFRFGAATFGSAKLRTHPVAGGMRIEQLQLRSAKQRIDVKGDWLGRGASAHTRLSVGVDSDDFGALVTGLGFVGRLAGGKGTVKFDAGWPGGPAAFKLDQLAGTLDIVAKEGRLVEIEPGAGRVLGLLSIAELPRRLTLDFRDFFDKGFAFNSIGGNIRFGNGRARTDDLVIDGPAAEIRIRGAADLRAQQFDQTIEVRPKAGNLLTAVGAIAGGPVGAAIGAAANVVLRKPLGQMAAKTYRVTGPWKDPKVEVIGRQESRLGAGAAVPSG